LWWGWKLFRVSREFDAVVTGNERAIQSSRCFNNWLLAEETSHPDLMLFSTCRQARLAQIHETARISGVLITASSRIVVVFASPD